MRLVIIAITFAVTLGAIFLFGGFDNSSSENKLANIGQALESIAATGSSTISRQSSVKKEPAKSSPNPTPTPSSAAQPTATSRPTTPTPQITTTHSPVPSATPVPTPTPTPEPQPTSEPTVSPTSGHTFYTSSHWKAKYYYCDTDEDWKGLSATYLKSFSSEAELLQNYSRILHELCIN